MARLIRRKYTIEASIPTLKRFVDQLVQSESFVQKIVSNSSEEYYYVTVIGTEEIHDKLKAQRFTNSVALHQ